MNINFKKGQWNEEEITHAYTYRFPYTNKFIQNNDCIENGTNREMTDGFDYISLITKEKFTLGTKITVNCSFEGNAAPLLVFTDSLDICDDGVIRYGNYFEVVLYKKGINVWRLWRNNKGKVVWHKLLGANFNVSENELHCLSVELKEKYFIIDIDKMTFELRSDELFESFHLGITGCEGVCKFFDMKIE